MSKYCFLAITHGSPMAAPTAAATLLFRQRCSNSSSNCCQHSFHAPLRLFHLLFQLPLQRCPIGCYRHCWWPPHRLPPKALVLGAHSCLASSGYSDHVAVSLLLKDQPAPVGRLQLDAATKKCMCKPQAGIKSFFKAQTNSSDDAAARQAALKLPPDVPPAAVHDLTPAQDPAPVLAPVARKDTVLTCTPEPSHNPHPSPEPSSASTLKSTSQKQGQGQKRRSCKSETPQGKRQRKEGDAQPTMRHFFGKKP